MKEIENNLSSRVIDEIQSYWNQIAKNVVSKDEMLKKSNNFFDDMDNVIINLCKDLHSVTDKLELKQGEIENMKKEREEREKDIAQREKEREEREKEMAQREKEKEEREKEKLKEEQTTECVMDEPDENSKQSDYNDTKIANDENSTNLSTQNSEQKVIEKEQNEPLSEIDNVVSWYYH